MRKDDDTAANRDSSQWALAYVYALSKRTDLYASYARVSNKNGAVFTVGNNTETGSGNKALNFGVRHSF
ncbi:MAG: porin [Noviherbaspirillum sp.]